MAHNTGAGRVARHSVPGPSNEVSNDNDVPLETHNTRVQSIKKRKARDQAHHMMIVGHSTLSDSPASLLLIQYRRAEPQVSEPLPLDWPFCGEGQDSKRKRDGGSSWQGG